MNSHLECGPEGGRRLMRVGDCRREIGEHAIVLHVAKKREAHATIRQRLQRMRARAAEARRLVDRAVATHAQSGTRFDLGEPGGDTAMTCSWQRSGAEPRCARPENHIFTHCQPYNVPLS